MRNRSLFYGCILALLLVFSPLYHAIAGENNASLVGERVLNFSLPSTQDRLIQYGSEYYGRQYLIITFFPAAFTPV
jgi:hypothetical protein